ncbi:MAG: hypothetical protein EP330_09630 [Deltaproteobacteria bacterium]|nr:MAG: hypothetical protein EP330_09630 [Deltaproteobacteria bacterium]
MTRWMLLGVLFLGACSDDVDEDGVPAGEDCDDLNPNVFPEAPDFRGDGCDADCGTEPDADQDDWPDAQDCAPEDPSVFPCAPDTAGDGIDSDCDGNDGPSAAGCASIDPDAPEDTPQLDASCEPLTPLE